MVVWGWGAGPVSVSPEAASGGSSTVSDCKAHPKTGLQLRSNANSVNLKMLESYGRSRDVCKSLRQEKAKGNNKLSILGITRPLQSP